VKYLFILVLLIVAATGGLLGAVVAYRWVDNMTQTARIVPGERVFVMPAGVVPRGGELMLPKEQREVAARRPNPVKPSPASVAMTTCWGDHGDDQLIRMGGVDRILGGPGNDTAFGGSLDDSMAGNAGNTPCGGTSAATPSAAALATTSSTATTRSRRLRTCPSPWHKQRHLHRRPGR